MSLESPTDITDQLEDLNPEDRVFRTASGYVVKVKHRLRVKNQDMVAFDLTGSLCDERGKAYASPDGFHPPEAGLKHWILNGEYAHQVVRMFHGRDVHPGPPAGALDARERQITELLDEARRVVVSNVELAAIAHAEADAILGGLTDVTPAPPLPPLPAPPQQQALPAPDQPPQDDAPPPEEPTT